MTAPPPLVGPSCSEILPAPTLRGADVTTVYFPATVSKSARTP